MNLNTMLIQLIKDEIEQPIILTMDSDGHNAIVFQNDTGYIYFIINIDFIKRKFILNEFIYTHHENKLIERMLEKNTLKLVIEQIVSIIKSQLANTQLINHKL